MNYKNITCIDKILLLYPNIIFFDNSFYHDSILGIDLSNTIPRIIYSGYQICYHSMAWHYAIGRKNVTIYKGEDLKNLYQKYRQNTIFDIEEQSEDFINDPPIVIWNENFLKDPYDQILEEELLLLRWRKQHLPKVYY